MTHPRFLDSVGPDAPRALPRPHRWAGVRPRNAVCAWCGYCFGGVAIDERGRLTCPECGFETGFDALDQAAVNRARVRRRLPVFRALTILILAGMLVAPAAFFRAPWVAVLVTVTALAVWGATRLVLLVVRARW